MIEKKFGEMSEPELEALPRGYIILDLFAGAGGFSCGFKQVFPDATFIGIDLNEVACQTYESNIGEAICRDVQDVWECDDLPWHVDILIGSPPCQDFSGLNMNGKRAMDPQYIKLFLKIRDYLQPEWWVMEESPFASKFVSKKWRKYQCANEHGLYHVRRRLFAGYYPAVNATKPRQHRHPTITAEEVKAFKSTAKHDWEHAKNCMSWFGRKMASWELQILMGFPPGYEFAGNYAERCRQIGNAVCPPVSRAIALAIKNQPTLKSFMRVTA